MRNRPESIAHWLWNKFRTESDTEVTSDHFFVCIGKAVSVSVKASVALISFSVLTWHLTSHPLPLSHISHCTGLEILSDTNSLVGVRERYVLIFFPGRGLHHGSKKGLQEAQVREEMHARKVCCGHDLGAMRVHRGRL